MVMGVLLLAAGPAGAAQSNLNWEQIQEATAHGKAAYEELKAKALPVDDLEGLYVREREPDIGRAALFTEFSTVALETRRWQAIARELKPEDIEVILAPLRGKLRFSVTLVGGRRDFLRHYAVRLLQGERRLEPASWDVFRGNPKPGAPGRYVASAQYFFAVKDLDLNGPVTLALTDQSGGEIRFDFDLARLR